MQYFQHAVTFIAVKHFKVKGSDWKMQQNIYKVVRYFQNLVKNLKLKLQRKPNPLQYIWFQDFLPCEGVARLLGYSFLPKSGTPPTKLAKLNGILSQAALVVFMIIYVASAILSIRSDQLYVTIENVLFIGVVSVISFKVYIPFYRKYAQILELIEKLDEYFPHSGVDQLMLNAHKHLNILQKFHKLCLITYNGIVTQYCLMPFMHQIYGKMKSIDIEWEHIFALELPLDQFNLFSYPLIYTFEAWTMTFGAQFVICNDLLFACIIQILAMEFDILGQKISEIEVCENEEEAIKELKIYVDIHQELIEMSEKIDEIFSPLQFCNSFGSITALCTACFLSVVNKVSCIKNELKFPNNHWFLNKYFLLQSGISRYFLIKYILFLPVFSTQIFIQCYFSQRLIEYF